MAGGSWGCGVYAAIAWYSVICVAFTAFLAATWHQQPLFPALWDSPGWTTAWLVAAIADYYVEASCLCGIILASETWLAGILWSLAICLLGAPFACAYVVVRLLMGRELALATHWTVQWKPLSEAGGWWRNVAVGFYVALGLAFSARLGWTVYNYPLWPLQTDSAAWAGEWLWTTLGDFYTLAFCVYGIIIASEGLCCEGLLWCTGITLIGGPVMCIWIVWRLVNHGTVALKPNTATA